ncbi:MAG: universal stress protein [Dehalococcoidia bacterium]
MFEKILVCLDGSKLAEQILPYATEQALRFNGKLVLLQVMTMPGSAYVGVEGIHAGMADIMEEEIQRRETEIKAYLDGIAGPLLKKGMALERVILRPSPAGPAIVGYARDNAIDLICMATHGHSGVRRIVVGSVADHVLRESGLPVLLIKPKETETS